MDIWTATVLEPGCHTPRVSVHATEDDAIDAVIAAYGVDLTHIARPLDVIEELGNIGFYIDIDVHDVASTAHEGAA